MIRQIDSLFILDTKHTSYAFWVLETGHLEHLHYGSRIDAEGLSNIACEKVFFGIGNAIDYDAEHKNLNLENRLLEISSYGKGDLAEPFVELVHSDGSSTCDFLYEKAEIKKGHKELKGLPSSFGTDEEVEQLVITLTEKAYHLTLELTYSVYEDCDIITKSACLYNNSDDSVIVERLLSNQLMMDEEDYDFIHFNGAWAREMNLIRQPIAQGKMVNSSITGTSSSRSNPFVMLAKTGTNEDAGACYGCNLIYSGNHYEAVEVNGYGKTRFVQGINPQEFAFLLEPGDVFQAPEAVMTYSAEGFGRLSRNMHRFVRRHIVRGEWAKKERPVLLNSWEAAYFDINEKSLVSMAKVAAKVGVELFVMDDGWFGKRNDDTSSLGDWTPNLSKLPNGISGICQKINDLGLMFGIWVEPEMVNVDSDLYRTHPDWVISVPEKHHCEGRNQRILDYTNPDVCQYIIEKMSEVFSSADITYVKWDMNRIFSDYYSPYLAAEGKSQKETAHRYILGLYKVMQALTTAFPHILFEGCSAGGNRFDLGILCYMPQIWASDDTDAWERMKIQTGYSYGYPMSTITAHVSACPNHQTLRTTPLETRFNVAAFGVLGYECNLKEMSKEELEAVEKQIAFYKEHRNLLQYGEYYRINSGDAAKNHYLNQGNYQWMVVSEDKKKAMAFCGQNQAVPNYGSAKLITKGLAEDKTYHFYNRTLKYDIRLFGDLVNTVSPIHIKPGSLLHNTVAKFVKMDGETEDYTSSGRNFNHVGVRLHPRFCGTGYAENVAYFQDYGSRVYVMEEVKE